MLGAAVKGHPVPSRLDRPSGPILPCARHQPPRHQGGGQNGSSLRDIARRRPRHLRRCRVAASQSDMCPLRGDARPTCRRQVAARITAGPWKAQPGALGEVRTTEPSDRSDLRAPKHRSYPAQALLPEPPLSLSSAPASLSDPARTSLSGRSPAAKRHRCFGRAHPRQATRRAPWLWVLWPEPKYPAPQSTGATAACPYQARNP